MISDRRKLLISTACIIGLAGSLQFYCLGHWPFSADEVATFAEAATLFADTDTPAENQYYRLPRMVPLSHCVHWIGYTAFGEDEFGSRVIMALLGTANVGLLFVLLVGLKGYPTAFATAILAASWPEHIYQSQQNRFYMLAALLSTLCMLCGAYAVERRSVALTVLACIAAIAAILSHTVTGLLLAMLFFGILAASVANREPLPWKMLLVVVITGLVALAFLVLHVAPLAQGWNANVSECGYSIARSVMAFVAMVGWPNVLLAIVGSLILMKSRSRQDWYWGVCALVIAIVIFLLPAVITYRPDYGFPFCTVVLVLTGCAIGTIYQYLREQSRAIAMVWLVSACIFNLPSLISYYQDGNRHDYRTAARYITANWQPGDRVLAMAAPGLIIRYAPICDPVFGMPGTIDALPRIRQFCAESGRLWIVLPRARSPRHEDLYRWLGRHCWYELEVRKKRFDYHDFVVDVFLHRPDPKAVRKPDFRQRESG